MGPSVASRIPFHDLCNLCEKLSSAFREKRLLMFSKYVTFFRHFGDKLKEEDPEAETSFFPVLRLLLPQLDRDRGAYGVKEHALANILIRILCLAKDGQDASKLLHFRTPRVGGAQAGDFAEVAFFVLKKRRCSEGKSLTVERVNAHLDNVALKHAAHDPRGMDDELIAVFKEMSAHESKWFIRMLLKDVKVGIGQTMLLNSFHPDATNLFDVCNNLHKVCATLHDPQRRLHEVEVSLFSPFRPMLAQQCDVRQVVHCFTSSSSCYCETKHDGERFQLHFSDGAFRYFSKKGHEYTDVYGSDKSRGILTPALASCLRPGLRNCILDGEMMVWDSHLETFRSKGDNIDVKSLKKGGLLKPCYCVFDVLMLDDEVLTNRPLSARVSLLEGLFQSSEGVILLTKRRTVTTEVEVLEELNQAIDDKLEGIMLKDPMSVYRPNARKAGWYKIKPEYTEGLTDQVDAIIVGGYYGEGRRSGYVSHFLLAAAVEGAGEPTEFHSLSRVGSGYTTEKLGELLRKLQPHWTKQCPAGVICTKEKADVWVEPRNSFLLQVKASELTRSSAFATGISLRFPRVQEVRYDKEWHECVTTAQLGDLAKMGAGKLCSRHVTLDAAPVAEEPKRRRTAAPPLLGPQFQAADVSQIPRECDALAGKELCVLTGFGGRTKQDVEADVHRRGGRLVQNPGPATWCLLASDASSARVANAVRSGRWDVVRTSWLYAAPAQWTPADLLGATSRTRALLATRYDAYGDSFTEAVTDSQLRELLEGVDVGHDQDLDLDQVDLEVFGGPSPYGVFRLCRAHFAAPSGWDTAAASAELRLLALDFGLFGGVVTPALEDSTTHVVVHSRCPEALPRWRDANRHRPRKFHIVSERWVRDSVAHRSRLLESHF